MGKRLGWRVHLLLLRLRLEARREGRLLLVPPLHLGDGGEAKRAIRRDEDATLAALELDSPACWELGELLVLRWVRGG